MARDLNIKSPRISQFQYNMPTFIFDSSFCGSRTPCSQLTSGITGLMKIAGIGEYIGLGVEGHWREMVNLHCLDELDVIKPRRVYVTDGPGFEFL